MLRKQLNMYKWLSLVMLMIGVALVQVSYPRGVLDFGLDGGVPPGPRDPNPCLE